AIPGPPSVSQSFRRALMGLHERGMGRFQAGLRDGRKWPGMCGSRDSLKSDGDAASTLVPLFVRGGYNVGLILEPMNLWVLLLASRGVPWLTKKTNRLMV